MAEINQHRASEPPAGKGHACAMDRSDFAPLLGIAFPLKFAALLGTYAGTALAAARTVFENAVERFTSSSATPVTREIAAVLKPEPIVPAVELMSGAVACSPATVWRGYPAILPRVVDEQELLERCQLTVRNVIDRLKFRLPAHITADDLDRVGTTGLAAAVRKSISVNPFSPVRPLSLQRQNSLNSESMVS